MQNPFKKKHADDSLHGMGWISPKFYPPVGSASVQVTSTVFNVAAALSQRVTKLLEQRYGGVPKNLNAINEIIKAHLDGKAGPQATPAIHEINRILKKAQESMGGRPMSIGVWNGPPGSEPLISILQGDADGNLSMQINLRSEAPPDEMFLSHIKAIDDAPDIGTTNEAFFKVMKAADEWRESTTKTRGFGADPNLN